MLVFLWQITMADGGWFGVYATWQEMNGLGSGYHVGGLKIILSEPGRIVVTVDPTRKGSKEQTVQRHVAELINYAREGHLGDVLVSIALPSLLRSGAVISYHAGAWRDEYFHLRLEIDSAVWVSNHMAQLEVRRLCSLLDRGEGTPLPRKWLALWNASVNGGPATATVADAAVDAAALTVKSALRVWPVPYNSSGACGISAGTPIKVNGVAHVCSGPPVGPFTLHRTRLRLGSSAPGRAASGTGAGRAAVGTGAEGHSNPASGPTSGSAWVEEDTDWMAVDCAFGGRDIIWFPPHQSGNQQFFAVPVEAGTAAAAAGAGRADGGEGGDRFSFFKDRTSDSGKFSSRGGRGGGSNRGGASSWRDRSAAAGGSAVTSGARLGSSATDSFASLKSGTYVLYSPMKGKRTPVVLGRKTPGTDAAEQTPSGPGTASAVPLMQVEWDDGQKLPLGGLWHLEAINYIDRTGAESVAIVVSSPSTAEIVPASVSGAAAQPAAPPAHRIVFNGGQFMHSLAELKGGPLYQQRAAGAISNDDKRIRAYARPVAAGIEAVSNAAGAGSGAGALPEPPAPPPPHADGADDLDGLVASTAALSLAGTAAAAAEVNSAGCALQLVDYAPRKVNKWSVPGGSDIRKVREMMVELVEQRDKEAVPAVDALPQQDRWMAVKVLTNRNRQLYADFSPSQAIIYVRVSPGAASAGNLIGSPVLPVSEFMRDLLAAAWTELTSGTKTMVELNQKAWDDAAWLAMAPEWPTSDCPMGSALLSSYFPRAAAAPVLAPVVQLVPTSTSPASARGGASDRASASAADEGAGPIVGAIFLPVARFLSCLPPADRIEWCQKALAAYERGDSQGVFAS